MKSLISQTSRQQFIQHSFPACMRTQGGLPPVKPRVVVRDQRSTQIILRPDAQTLAQLAVQVKEKKIRTDVSARTSDLLKKVFGSQQKK